MQEDRAAEAYPRFYREPDIRHYGNNVYGERSCQ